ncbi:MAG: hypothetical protein ACOC2L_02380 [Candidatus Sumerlaeota bacterium]
MKTTFTIKTNRIFPVLLLTLALFLAAGKPSADEAELARHIISKAGRPGGLILCVDSGDLALQFAEQSPMMVVALQGDAESLRKTCETALQKGLLCLDMYAVQSGLNNLPMGSHTADLLVLTGLDDHRLAELDAEEILRVLTPINGKAWLGRAVSQGSGLSRKSLEQWAENNSHEKAEIIEDGQGLWLVVTKPALEGATVWSVAHIGTAGVPAGS